MPNSFAYLALLMWPLVVFLLFRRLPLPAALAWSIIGGYLLLPERTGWNLPAVPTIDKGGVPSLAAAVMCLLAASAGRSRHRERARSASRRPRPDAGPPAFEMPVFQTSGGTLVLQGLLLLAPATIFVTVFQNMAPVRVGPNVIPGLRLYDAFSILGNLLITLTPFLLGRRYLATDESHRILLRVLAAAALGYSLLVLYEIRMSPVLNIRIYGFFGSSFAQSMRGGDWRPLVFLQHGLWLAIFNAMAIIAAAALWRHRKEAGGSGRWIWASLWLLMALVLSSSFGALVIALLLIPCVLFLGIRGQLLVAASFAAMVLLFPMLRGADLVPTQRLVSFFQSIDPARAASLDFRFRNEDILLARANEKPLAGWGSWGRNRVYDEEREGDASVTDGIWVILMGTSGWLGYIAQFGLLTLPAIFMAFERRRLDLSYATAGLSLVLTANLVDLIPNATLTPVTWLVAGAMAGRYALAPRAAAGPEMPARPSRHPGRRPAVARHRAGTNP